MTPRVSVWRDRYVVGWEQGTSPQLDAKGNPAPHYPILGLVDALRATYGTDAHFVPYRIPIAGLEAQPRINEPAVAELDARGLGPVFDVLVADVDHEGAHKGDGTPQDEVDAWSMAQIAAVEASDFGAGLGWYLSRGGCRLLWTLSTPVDRTAYLETMRAARTYLSGVGVVLDPLTDWNRCYRLPYVRRDGRDERRPASWDRLGPANVDCLEISFSCHDSNQPTSTSTSVFAGLEAVPSRFELPSAIDASVGLGRQRTLFRYASKIRASGLDEVEILAACRTINETRCRPPLADREVVHATRQALRYDPDPIAAAVDASKPTVVIRKGVLPALIDAAEDLIRDENVYQRGGVLVGVARDPDPAGGLTHTPDPAVIREHRLHGLRRLIAEGATWREIRKAKPEDKARMVAAGQEPTEFVEVAADVPLEVVQGLRESLAWSRFRRLVGVTESPTMRSDGSILDRSGYDDASGIFFAAPPGLIWPTVPTSPTQADAEHALGVLEAILDDFPFGSDAHRSVAVAAMLTAVGRFAVNGPTPLFLFDAHTAGSGKGLLADLVSILVSGRRAAAMAADNDNAETEKRITATLIAGRRVVLLDNAAGALGGPALDAVLTSDVWSGRVLGRSEIVEVPNRATWLATANNAAIRGDLGRRSLRCYLDAEVERPEERRGFKVADLRGYVLKHRGSLVGAALTVLRAYKVAGSPALSLSPFGSFEAWDRVVRRALVWAGSDDPCETRRELYEAADRDRDAWATVLEAWSTLYGETETTVPDVLADVASTVFGAAMGNEDKGRADAKVALRDALIEIAGTGNRELDPRKVGWAFAKHRNRIVEGRKLVQSTKANRGRRWYVDLVNRVNPSTQRESDKAISKVTL